jgi:hypothetical protein
LVWSNDEVQKLADQYVAVADELHSLRTGKTSEAAFFQTIFAQTQKHPGHQGVFRATPSGRLLASSTCYEPEQIIELLNTGLIAWNELKTEQRLEPKSDLIGKAAGDRFEDFYPDDGLVLRVTARDLPATELASVRNSRWHRYYLWFNAEELKSMLPQEFEKGQHKVIPKHLSTRIAALALLDKGKVDGFTRAFRDSGVENAELTFSVIDTTDQNVRFEIRGSTETRTADEMAFVANMPKFEDIPEYRGVKTSMLGFATLDRASGRFTEFRLIAAGTRFGGAFVGREPDDWSEHPIGFSFELGGFEPAERVAPEFPERYLWLDSIIK